MIGGQAPGNLELIKIDTGVALRFGNELWRQKFERLVTDDIPNFRMNFLRSRGLARYGKTLRKDMPVLEECDLPQIKFCLAAVGDKIYQICNADRAAVSSLRPIQEQIYYDVSLTSTATNGIRETTKWVSTRPIYVTEDLRILDGHHGWLSGMLLDPNLSAPLLRLKMPLEKALPFLLRFSDAQGRPRNG